MQMRDARQVTFDMEELFLVLECLEQVADELPNEIHHTFSRSYRDDLERRQDRLSALIARLRAVVGVQPGVQPEAGERA